MSVNHHVAAELAAAGGHATITPLGAQTAGASPGTGTWCVTLTRALPSSPDDVWPWLVQKKRLTAWSPIVPDEDLTSTGTRRSRENPTDEDVLADVLEVDPSHTVRHRWGDATLTWTIVGMSARETGGTPVTQLTLQHEAGSREEAINSAAGWDVCLAVLATLIRQGATPENPHHSSKGTPRPAGADPQKVSRVVGEKALDYGWEDLRARYAETTPEA
ncbi:MAG: SRPBCC domain-containing protein [bacterium]|nr:SRPBCC domain-containing protein [bacterium]